MEEATITQPSEEATNSSPARPEWLPQKFENPEAFAKSYGELESKIGQREEDLRTSINKQIQDDFHKNRPASVGEYKIPESIDESLANDNELFKWWADHAYEQGFNQEQFENGINQYAQFFDSMGPDLEAEKGKLGDNAEARLEAVSAWTHKTFTEEELPAVQQLGSTAEGVAVLEKIMEMQKGTSFNSEGTQPASISQEDLDGMMRDPRYWKPGERDQNFVDKVTQGFNKLYGS